MRNMNTGKAERNSFADSTANHRQIDQPVGAGFFVSAGTLGNREFVRDIGTKDTHTPFLSGIHISDYTTQSFTQTITSKNLFGMYGSHRVSQKFFSKKSVDGSLIFPYRTTQSGRGY